MVKKKFDKKSAKTYSLVYQPTVGSEDQDQDDDQGQHLEKDSGDATHALPEAAGASRVLHELTYQSRSQPLPEDELQRFRQKQGHPLEWLMEERGLLKKENTLDEKKRHEMIELGFDDDGYDYMQHLKTLDEVSDGRSQVLREVGKAEEAVGDAGEGQAEQKLIISQKKILFDTPGAHIEREKEAELVKAAKAIEKEGANGVFVRAGKEFVAEDDVAFFDASQLTVMQQVATEDDVTGMMGGVTAFAKRRDERLRERRDYEITELERMIEQAERETEEEGRVLGDGDLLDDFILAATEMQRGEDGGDEEGDEDVGGGSSCCSDSNSFEWFSDGGRSSVTDDSQAAPGLVGVKGVKGRKAPGPGSIASTYWREERQDRKNLLSVIDEQFEHLALEYDEDELGDMEELADDIHGGADVDDFESVLDEFIRDHPRRGDFGDGMQSKLFLAEDMEKHGFGNDHAALSIQMAKEAIRKMDEAAAAGEGEDRPAANAHVEIDRRRFQKEENKWDCESVLSLRSNLYNHPGTITEPTSRPPRTIKLGKNGLPVGYGPGGAFVSTKMDGINEHDGDDGGDREGEDDEDQLMWARPVTGPNIRKKGETVEEKKARKAAVKAAKRESRATKKEMKVMFAQERTKASLREGRASAHPSGIHM
jgi:hypothetical protein